MSQSFLMIPKESENPAVGDFRCRAHSDCESIGELFQFHYTAGFACAWLKMRANAWPNLIGISSLKSAACTPKIGKIVGDAFGRHGVKPKCKPVS
jgi:hypothetical protein